MAHQPERMCIACRKMLPKQDLLRFVLVDDNIQIDSEQKIQKRGFYICKSEACIGTARKKKSINRILKKSVPDNIYDKLDEVIKNG